MSRNHLSLYCAPQFLARNNFYILIDDHSEDPTVQNNPGQWVNYWVQLMTDIIKDGPSSLRVMVDPLNEPDHAGYTWTQVAMLQPIAQITTASQILILSAFPLLAVRRPN